MTVQQPVTIKTLKEPMDSSSSAFSDDLWFDLAQPPRIIWENNSGSTNSGIKCCSHTIKNIPATVHPVQSFLWRHLIRSCGSYSFYTLHTSFYIFLFSSVVSISLQIEDLCFTSCRHQHIPRPMSWDFVFHFSLADTVRQHVWLDRQK